MRYLSHKIEQHLINFYRQQAQQKIMMEGWKGRNTEVKIQNFVNCWVTEEAFKQLLIQRNVKFKHRGLYFGDAAGAGEDFTVYKDGEPISLGLRSISSASLFTWKTVAYPDDRFREEQHKIAKHHVVCHNDDGMSRFMGIISKVDLLSSLEQSEVKFSKKNQEKFRLIPLENFSYDNLIGMLDGLDKTEK